MTVTSEPRKLEIERQLSVGRELQPVRTAHIGRERLRHLLAGNDQ